MGTQAQATPLEPGNGMPVDPQSRVSEIKQRRDESQRWMQDNYWDEWSEVWRSVNCKTKPVMVINKDGNEVEDLNRTNVCMPEMNLIVRRKTARLTANPPTLNYYVPGEDETLLAERLTARAYFEYDRSGEAFELRRGVQQAVTFGWTISKTFHDEVTIERQMRYQRAKLTRRAELMKLQGAPQDEIDGAVQSQGDTLSPEEIQQMIADHGDELRSSVPTTMYEGPVTKCRFIGDIFLEPGCLTLNDSYSVGEQYTETDLWIRQMLAKKYKDPENPSVLVPVFSEAAVKDLLESDSMLPQDRKFDLKNTLRDAVQQTQPRLEKRLLPGKRFEIYEYHAPDKYGRLWIEYMGNDRIYLGKQPYPFDFGGRTVYSEYVPWPNLIGAIGDSSPRLLRFLHAMHNAAVGQRNDLIRNQLRRTWLSSNMSDIPDEVIERDFGRVLVVADVNGLKELQESPVPQAAWESEAQITGEMQKAEPIIGGVEPGGAFNPQAAKTATTAILAAKSGDVLTNYEIDNLNLYLKDVGEKKLEIHRQLADSPIQVPNRPQYIKGLTGISQRYGKAAVITIDPMEIQEPLIQVEPVAGSTLAVDDELRTNKIQTLYQMAEADPSIWNKYNVAKLVLTTVKGVGDTSQLLNDPANQAPPGPKVSINVSIPLDKMEADVQNQALTLAGLEPSQDAVARSHMEAIQEASKTADAAVNLGAHAIHPDEVATQSKAVEKRVNGAP